jgi:hypothetical protein
VRLNVALSVGNLRLASLTPPAPDSIIAFWHPEFEAQPYQTFLIYLGFTIGAFLLNTFAVRLLPMVDRTAFWWALGGALVVSERVTLGTMFPMINLVRRIRVPRS